MKHILLMSLLLSSCSTYVRTLTTRMMSPEAQGGLGKGEIEARFQAAKRDQLDFGDDTTTNAIDRAETVHALAGYAEIGFFKYVDFFILQQFSSSSIIGAKYQIAGNPKKEAKTGNFSTSLMAGYGHYNERYSSAGDFDAIVNHNIKNMELENTHYEGGLISGYRWRADFLQYVNVIYTDDTYEGKVTNLSGTLTDAEFEYRQDGMIYSTGFIYYFKKAQWKLDYSHFVSDWSRTDKQTVNTINTALGFNW